MKPNLIANSAALAEAIHYSFSGSDACHCHGDGKLSEAEMLDHLCRRGFIHHADAGKQALDVNIVFADHRHWHSRRELSKKGVNYLPQLQAWTFADLLGLPDHNVRDARRIEFIMSRYGLALKDGDPSRYQHLFEKDRKQEPDGRPIARTPDEERAIAMKQLVKIGQRMLGQGGSFINAATRLSGRKKIGGGLINSVRAADRINQDAMVVAGVVSQLERQETATKKVRGGRRKAVMEQGNVVTGAFAERAATVH